MNFTEWVLAGRPFRSTEQVEKLFNDHCLGCDFYDAKGLSATMVRGVCKSCMCHVGPVPKVRNKLNWMNKGCPEGFFNADVS